MRIVGGKYRGRALQAPPGRDLRPTSDRAREAVFNILAHGIDWPGFAPDGEGVTVLDVFCGTGAFAIEALSRGAGHAVLIDSDGVSLQYARRNAGAIGEARRITPLRLDATRLAPPPRAAKVPAALAFLDAPYDMGLSAPALVALAAKGWIGPGGLVVVETAADEDLPVPPAYETLDARTYGAARVTFLLRKA